MSSGYVAGVGKSIGAAYGRGAVGTPPVGGTKVYGLLVCGIAVPDIHPELLLFWGGMGGGNTADPIPIWAELMPGETATGGAGAGMLGIGA